jgi:hypothetical protein
MRGPGDARDTDTPEDGSGQREPASPDSAPGIDEAVRQLGATGRATWTAGRDASKAFRILLAADVSLARSAFGRTLAFTGVAIAFGASAWLLLTSALSIAVTVIGGWMAMRYFEHTRLQATRRQLARLGIGELSGFMPDAGSGASTEAATERVTDAGDGEPIKKGLGVDITPP